MIKIALIQFESNLAVSIDGNKRQDFRKWNKVIVSKSDILPLLRLWCTKLWEIELDAEKNLNLFKEVKEEKKTETTTKKEVEADPIVE